MKRKDAIQTIVKALDGSQAVVSTLGLISRELYENFDSERNFYMVGSMGLALPIGYGVAVSKPKKHVVVIDGDGSILMNLGSMATISYIPTKNLTHIVLDNRAYASCSDEPSISSKTRLDDIAKVTGYKHVYRVQNEQDLRSAIKKTPYDGPNFILAEIELGGNRHPRRILELPKIKERFIHFLSKE